MRHKYDSNAFNANLYAEIDRIHMSSADKARAKAALVRSEYIADLMIAAARHTKAAVQWVGRAIGSLVSKPTIDPR
jgi:hypothetical protein